MVDISVKSNVASNFFKTKVENGIGNTSKVPWVEKYRPKSINDITAQEEIVLLFKNALETGELPNLLFYGPPGTGKTSAILALAHDLYGVDQIKNRVLELNASDERGIQVIREKVKTFAQISVSNVFHSVTKKPIPCYKIIILDEADNMTSSAQAALRRIMETQMRTTRFCLICNYISKLIDPITSRCSKYFFKPLSLCDSLSRLTLIQKNESLKISNEALEMLIKFSEGDLRKAVMLLQSCCYFYRNTEITVDHIISICGVVPQHIIDNLILSCLHSNFDALQYSCKEFVAQGYSISKFVSQFHDTVMENPTITDGCKSKIFIKLSEIDRSISDGADEYLMLFSLLSYSLEVIKNEK